jgi:hypothetical protein
VIILILFIELIVDHILDNVSELGIFSQIEYLNISNNRLLDAEIINELLTQVQSLLNVTLFGTGVNSIDELDLIHHPKITLKM